MQRMGGGSRKIRRGGGNDPRCGCDMRVGWPTELKAQGGGGCGCGARPLMSGGGSCGAMLPMRGGGCGCGAAAPMLPMSGGGKRKTRNGRKARKGAGLLFANGGGACCPGQVLRFGTHTGGSLCGDFGCPFKGTGYCDFYAKGGAWGNDHYGEPIGIQAKLRGGDNSNVSQLVEKIAQIDGKLTNFFADYSLLSEGASVSFNTANTVETRAQEIDAAMGELQEMIANQVVSDDIQTQIDILLNKKINMDEIVHSYQTSATLEGGYKPTRKNLKYLRRYKKGQSIGFTMTSSLKAKGLIPRTSRKNRGKKIVSAKYK